jgi:hypothetical protein
VPGLVFMFCAPGHTFGDTEGTGSRFYVLRFQICFRRYRGRRFLFSCFTLPNPFSDVPRSSGPVFMLCTPKPISNGNENAGSRFYVLRSRTRFQRYQGRRVPFSCFALPTRFSAVPRAPVPIFMFCTPDTLFDGTEGAESRFHVLPC